VTTGGDNRFDGPCVVCGESVKGRPYLALGMFGVFSERGDGLFFRPDGAPSEHAEWGDIPCGRAVHTTCVQNYVDGVLSDLAHERRSQAEGQ
jgi:hypothetical protein